MRLNNSKRYTVFKYVYLVLLLSVGFDFLLYNIDGSLGSYDLFLSPIVLLILIIIIYRGNPLFRYDSDGEVLILDSKEPVLGGVFRSNKLYEFPKRKLLGYEIRRLPLRKVLVLKIKSKGAKYKLLKVTISYLTRSEERDLARSLDSVIKMYKNENNEEDSNDD